MVQVHFTSDNHWRHANIIRLCNRPFASVQEMDEIMVERWNAAVRPGDTVYHLGDFTLSGSQAADQILSRLHGHIHFIWGNHDRNPVRRHPRWRSSQYGLEISAAGKPITLCHYAHRTWNKCHHGALMLFGHSHGSMPGNSQSLDVGVDHWDFRPVTIEQIMERMAGLPSFQPEDHHTPEAA